MSETRICANCGEDHPLDAMFRVGSDWLCESCADEFTVICDACGERIYSEDVIEDCNHIIHRDRAYWDDDDAYCSSCWDDHCSIIHEYSYTPDLVFHGKGLRHFGVALEIDNGVTDRYNAEKIVEHRQCRRGEFIH